MPVWGEHSGMPWTTRFSFFWLYIARFVTLGIIDIVLGLYLGFWIRDKHKPSFAFYAYLLTNILWASCIIMHFFTTIKVPSGFDDYYLLLMIAGEYLLRWEVKKYFRNKDGSEIEIGPIFTFIFGAAYINNCIRLHDYANDTSITRLNIT